MRLAAVAVLLLASCAIAPDVRLPVATSAVRIRSVEGSGTGSPISCEPLVPGSWLVEVLTAKHVAKMEGPFIADLVDGRSLYGGVLSREHPKLDAAIITFVSTTYVEPSPISFEPLQRGDKVWIAGYPLGGPIVLTEGLASDSRRVSAPGWFGNSGGPVIGPDGAIRGIAVALAVGNTPWGTPQMITHLAMIVPTRLLQDWLQPS